MKNMLLATAAALVVASPTFAAEHFKGGDVLIRARALNVMPDESSSMNIADNVKLSNTAIPELDATYFFTPNIAAELIAGVSPHRVSTKGGVDAGDVWLLPPTLTLQYHFNQLASVKPYVGAGINYTHFFGANGGSLSDPKYDDSFGAALQAGADVPLGNNWYANFDVKKIYINTTARFSGGAVRADVDIDPWIVGVGVGYKF
jgi:outer membrane protein